MKTALISIASIIASILVLLLITISIRSYLQKKIVNVFNIKTDKKDIHFLKGIDFSDGNYALVVKNKETLVLIDNDKLLEKYRDSIKVKRSWASFLPGEGGFRQGLYLFKNNKRVKSVNHKLSKIFETGNIEQYGKPVTNEFIDLPKKEYVQKLDSLKQQSNNYIYHTNEDVIRTYTVTHDYQFNFHIFLPSVFVKQETDFDNEKFREQLKNHILETLKVYNEGFKVQVQESVLWSNELGEPALINLHDRGDYLRDKKGMPLYLEGFKLHNYRLLFYIENKEFYETLKKHNFKQYIENQNTYEIDVLEVIQKQLSKAKETLSQKQVGIAEFRDGISFSKVREKTYRINYFKLKKQITY